MHNKNTRTKTIFQINSPKGRRVMKARKNSAVTSDVLTIIIIIIIIIVTYEIK
jgi:hypothetical protein